MVKKLLCVSSELNDFTNGKIYNIVPNEASRSFDKWVYNDNGEYVYNDNREYVYITNSLINTYFKLVKEEEGAAKAVNVDEMNIDELYHLQSKLKEQIDKEVIQAIVEVNISLELLKDNLDVLLNVCQMFDIQMSDSVENLQNKLLTIMYDVEEKYIFN